MNTYLLTIVAKTTYEHLVTVYPDTGSISIGRDVGLPVSEEIEKIVHMMVGYTLTHCLGADGSVISLQPYDL